ncbi:MAG: tRNA 2-thiouridine(34) synthase MnmA [Desulfobulbaceae bacterium]|nr:MAG: tRNA 2-thiouridine(34) synthase MnmA [Desulfobulbaceae bacterium]
MADIAVAMSGGVDSTVTARLLVQQGHAVCGLFMALGQPDLDRQVARVQEVARRLGVPVRIIELSEAFRRHVLDYFVGSYLQGRTPNPCVVCNPVIKFGRLLAAARQMGCTTLATGHYVRLRQSPHGLLLCKGRDPLKDQSYFLCGLQQQELAHLAFPLGDLHKEEVYRLAEDFGFDDFRGRESQDVCFLKGQSVQHFLEGYGVPLPGAGEVVDDRGRVLGRHGGIHRYTIGQRRGLGIPGPEPLYVVGLDVAHNRVIVGTDEHLRQQRLLIAEMNWLAGTAPPLPATLTVKIRYRHQGAAARVKRRGTGYEIVFHEPQRAITPGQFAVLYEGDTLLGGGAIV